MKLPGMNYLRERAGFREAFQSEYGQRGTYPNWMGWKGRAKFRVRWPEAEETQHKVEWEAFRVWFHAKHRAPALDAQNKGKRAQCIDPGSAWAGWQARYQWHLAGKPVKTLITGYEWFAICGVIVIVLSLIFGHY